MLTISSVPVASVPSQVPTVSRVQPIAPGKVSEAVNVKNQGVVAPVGPAGQGTRALQAYAPPSLPPVAPAGEVARAHNFNDTTTPERTGLGLNVAAALAQSASVQAQMRAQALARSGSDLQSAPGTGAPTSRLDQDAQATGLTQAAPEQRAQARLEERVQQERFRGELPQQVQSPDVVAMESQINELLPNMWKASRIAVDMLIGDEARAEAAARAQRLTPEPAPAVERASDASENYALTAQLSQSPASGRNVDRLV